MAPSLLGTWDSDRTDEATMRAYGNVTMRFEPDGKLEYIAHVDAKDAVMHMTYRVDGGWIVTDQPSHPREQRNEYQFTQDGKLVIVGNAGEPTVRFVRR